MSDRPPLGIFGLHPGLDGCETHPRRRPGGSYYHPNEPTPERVEQLRAMPYKKYLDTEEWAHRRRHILHRAQSKCEQCGNRYGRLEIHHLTYERRGCEHDDDLIVLCHKCHHDIHRRDE